MLHNLLGAREALVGVTTGHICCHFAGGAGTILVGECFVFLFVVSTKFDFINHPTRFNKVRSFDLHSFSPGGSGGSASLPSRRRLRASIETGCCYGGCSWLFLVLGTGVLGSVVSWHFSTGQFLRMKCVEFWVCPTDIFAGKMVGGQEHRGVYQTRILCIQLETSGWMIKSVILALWAHRPNRNSRSLLV
jgi:hypothetical protein